jgi:hypothetical protein
MKKKLAAQWMRSGVPSQFGNWKAGCHWKKSVLGRRCFYDIAPELSAWLMKYDR